MADFVSVNGLPFQKKYIVHLWRSDTKQKVGFNEAKNEDIFEEKFGIMVVLDVMTEKGNFSIVNFQTKEERDQELERLNKELTE